jgi:predicted acylesterase/phospholipase RssA
MKIGLALGGGAAASWRYRQSISYHPTPPHLGAIGLFDFHRWQEGIEAGRTAVREAETQLTNLFGLTRVDVIETEKRKT